MTFDFRSIAVFAVPLFALFFNGCLFDRSGINPGPLCGNGSAEGTEPCDGTDLGGQDCVSVGFREGELACGADCTFDTSHCVPLTCGNQIIDGGEQCDATDLGGENCENLGFTGGTLGCTETCSFDTSNCIPPDCGNDRIDPPEQCDGSDFGGHTCRTLGFGPGSLACTETCVFNTSGCALTGCGNNSIEPGEECDGADLGGQTCQSLGFGPGMLACTEACELDLSECPGGCGNGVKESDELCDDQDFGGLSCVGGLLCTADCLLDASNCILPSAGDGADGPLTADATNPVNLNQSAAPAYAVTAIGTDWVEVAGGPPTFSPDDEVILINMRGNAADCSRVGFYEFLTVATVDPTGTGFTSAIQGAYGVAGDNSNLTGQRIIVMRVPHFSTVDILSGGFITGDAWNGTMGGILVMRVSDELAIDSGGLLSADGLGYRGGIGYTNNDRAHGRQGESICGNPQSASTSPNDGGGGGGRYTDSSDDCGQGGGGGGYGQPGTWEPYSQTCIDHGNTSPAQNGGQTYGATDLGYVEMGSGGGAGASDDHSNDSGTGGRGGGIILIFAARIVLNGTLSARGTDGTVPGDYNDSGNGGGGSGGAIHLLAGELEGTGAVNAEGGFGPLSQGSWNSPGGNGGDGRIRIDYHHAGTYPFGSLDADGFILNMCAPDPGHTSLNIQ